MGIDFEKMELPQDISGRHVRTVDTREGFANLIYTSMNGIAAHAVAMKIYHSKGETEYTDEEYRLIKGAAEKFCLPAFIDALNKQAKKGTKA